MTLLPEFPDSGAIEMVSYQSQWPAEFEALKADLEQSLGSLALQIDHIGSTSIPGLAAKDIIDIQVTVANLKAPELLICLRQSEYILFESYRDQIEGLANDSNQLDKLFLKNKPSQRRANIHIRQAGLLNQAYPLLFRDYLRHHPAEREIYSLLKHRIAEIFPTQIEGYLYIKDPLMDLIYLQAQRWADQSQRPL